MKVERWIIYFGSISFHFRASGCFEIALELGFIDVFKRLAERNEKR